MSFNVRFESYVAVFLVEALPFSLSNKFGSSSLLSRYSRSFFFLKLINDCFGIILYYLDIFYLKTMQPMIVHKETELTFVQLKSRDCGKNFYFHNIQICVNTRKTPFQICAERKKKKANIAGPKATAIMLDVFLPIFAAIIVWSITSLGILL